MAERPDICGNAALLYWPAFHTLTHAQFDFGMYVDLHDALSDEADPDNREGSFAFVRTYRFLWKKFAAASAIEDCCWGADQHELFEPLPVHLVNLGQACRFLAVHARLCIDEGNPADAAASLGAACGVVRHGTRVQPFLLVMSHVGWPITS